MGFSRMNYYNEWEPFAAEWLKELIKEGLIPDGDVDSRSIEDVRPRELKGYTQCHFFAGIGGWSRALELAGWGSDRPVWTGSPPCQSFSVAGKGKGKDDERHLWPVFFNLIRECQPSVVFGEQVAAAIRYGWLDDLQKDFKKEGYASGACVLPSGGVGSPHKRDRLFFTAKFVADALNKGLQGHRGLGQESVEERRERKKRHCTQSSLRNNSMADPDSSDRWAEQKPKQQPWDPRRQSDGNSGIFSAVADPTSDGCGQGSDSQSSQRPEDRQEGCEVRSFVSDSCDINGGDFWSDSTVVHCRDGKGRPIPTEPALFPLAHGVSNRVGILRGAGNSIVPQAGAEIIKAFMCSDVY